MTVEAAPPPPSSSSSSDVFLSFNSQDRTVVRELARRLKARGLDVWLDEHKLRPGDLWQNKIERAIGLTPAAVICIGSGGLQYWAQAEMRALLSQSVRRGLRLIPLLLPGTQQPALPPFLEQFVWLDCRGGFSEKLVGQLLSGIRQNAPAWHGDNIPVPHHRRNGRRTEPVVDELLKQHIQAIVRRRQEVAARAETEPHAAAHIARLVVEEIALHIHLRNIGPTGDTDIDQVIEAVTTAGAIPSTIRPQLVTVLQQGRPRPGLNSGAMSPQAHDLTGLQRALDTIVDWYITVHLDFDITQLTALSNPSHEAPPAIPNLTPATFTSIGGSIGTRWLDGELIPLWRGRNRQHDGRILMTMSNGKPMAPLEMRIEACRPHYVGRKSIRRDQRTRNDLVIKTESVSRDQAAVEVLNGRVTLYNTSTKDNVAVGFERLSPGSYRVLHHRAPLSFGNASGVFLDGRFYDAAPESAIDPASGLLSRDGLSCEIALALAGRRNRVIFFARYSPDEEQAAVDAALLLHQGEPELTAGRIGHLAALICDSPTDMDQRLNALRDAGLAPSLAGYLPLSGNSTHANAIIETAVSALSRLVAAGAPPERVMDLSRYAIPSVSLATLAAHASDAYAVGGGVVLFALEEMERLIELAHPARAAVELEFREMLSAALGPTGIICPIDEGLLAVLTHKSAELLAREQAARWRARGPLQVGAIELDRCTRSMPLSEPTVESLVAGGADFAREAMLGVATRLLPTPLAYPLEQATHTASTAERLNAMLRALEQCWRLVAAVLAAAHRQRFHDDPLMPSGVSGWAQPWLGLAKHAAAQLRDSDERIAELAEAVCELGAEGGVLDATTTAAVRASTLLQIPAAPPDQLDAALDLLREVTHATLTSLRPLRGWSLVAIRQAQALDIHGRTLRVDYTDFSGPHANGVSQRISITDSPVHQFVYLARWAEGLMVVLDPWVRHARNPQSGTDELFMIESWPTAPGQHDYRAATSDTRIQLEITSRHLS